MSRFFSKKHSLLVPYTPGEQPKDMQYIKLNTNESPYPPSSAVALAVAMETKKLQLYSDPECTELVCKIAEVYGVESRDVIVSNGSDEILNFAFIAFADNESPLVFPDITYGFYPVFANLNGIPYNEIPLKDDLSVNAKDYVGVGKTVVLANPNAPTGLCLSVSDIEEIVSSNPDNVVIIDEAYVDFGAESVVPLTKKYENLLVVQTFSKSRSMAGARLGFAIGSEKLIADLNTVRYSTNPYNVNRMTMAAGVAALSQNEYYMENCKRIAENREYTKRELERLGFSTLDSRANFLFAKSGRIGGRELYLALKQKGILVRYLGAERISEYNRISIGTRDQMEKFVSVLEEILKEREK